MTAKSTILAMGCIALFLLPFAAVGLITAGSGVLRGLQGNWREGLMLVLFGMVFAGFAAALIAAVIVGRRDDAATVV